MANKTAKPRSSTNKGASAGSSRGANGPRSQGSSRSGSRGSSGRGGAASRGARTGPVSQSTNARSDSGPRPAPTTAAPASKEVTLPAQIVVRDLAEEMQVSPIELIKALMNAGIMANINQVLDHDTAAIIAEEMGYTIVVPEKPAEPEVAV